MVCGLVILEPHSLCLDQREGPQDLYVCICVYKPCFCIVGNAYGQICSCFSFSGGNCIFEKITKKKKNACMTALSTIHTMNNMSWRGFSRPQINEMNSVHCLSHNYRNTHHFILTNSHIFGYSTADQILQKFLVLILVFMNVLSLVQ